MKVDFLEHFGSDLMVVNCARVSFDKWHTEFAEGDIKLIKYLAEHNHWSPFAHPKAQFRIEAPIFVARQLAKHQVGMDWNEVSRRYVDYEPTFCDFGWRKRAKDKKQGSAEPLDQDEAFIAFGAYRDAIAKCKAAYLALLGIGVCPEQARAVLPQSMMTKWIWTGSLYGFARVCRLRLAPDTQEETRIIVQQISDKIQELFPYSWEALKNAR